MSVQADGRLPELPLGFGRVPANRPNGQGQAGLRGGGYGGALAVPAARVKGKTGPTVRAVSDHGLSISDANRSPGGRGPMPTPHNVFNYSDPSKQLAVLGWSNRASEPVRSPVHPGRTFNPKQRHACRPRGSVPAGPVGVGFNPKGGEG